MDKNIENYLDSLNFYLESLKENQAKAKTDKEKETYQKSIEGLNNLIAKVQKYGESSSSES